MATAQEIINDVWQEVLDNERRAILMDIADGKADQHAKCNLFDKGANYRYFAGGKEGESEIRWCYSVYRNVAGYFLAWREKITGDYVYRDQFMAHKIKRNLITAMRRKAYPDH